VKQAQFIVGLKIAVHCFTLTLPLSRILQSIDTDWAAACSRVKETITVLENMRKDMVTSFSLSFSKASQTCQQLNVEVKFPRTSVRQTNRANYTAALAEENYRLSVYLPFIDYLLQELNGRFSDRFCNIIPLQSLIPSNIGRHSVEDILTASEIYAADLPSSMSELAAELAL
jgi:hypothetical protein